MMQKFLFNFAVSLFLVVMGFSVLHPQIARNAYACSCLAPGDAKSELDSVDAVFEGVVTNISESPFYGVLDIQFSPNRYWKGNINNTITVTTENQSAACGFPFEKGESYLVYAYEEEGSLSTGICSRTALSSAASEDIESFGEGTNISSTDPSPTPLSSEVNAPNNFFFGRLIQAIRNFFTNLL